MMMGHGKDYSKLILGGNHIKVKVKPGNNDISLFGQG
jgi:hypothetical protein